MWLSQSVDAASYLFIYLQLSAAGYGCMAVYWILYGFNIEDSSGDFKLRSETKKTNTDYMCDPRTCCPLVQTFRFWIEVCKQFLSYSHTWPLHFTNVLPPTQNAPHKWTFCVLSWDFPCCFELNRQLLLAEVHWGGSREWHASFFSPVLLANVKSLLSHAGICCCVCLTTLHKVLTGWRRGRVTEEGKEEVTTMFGLHMHEWSISGTELCSDWASRNNYCMFLQWLAPRSHLFSMMMSFLSFYYKFVVCFRPKVKF